MTVETARRCRRSPRGCAASRSSPVRDILALTEQPGVISFAGGLPAPELFDAPGLRAAFAAALADDGRRPLAAVLDDRGRPGAARRGRRAADRARPADATPTSC